MAQAFLIAVGKFCTHLSGPCSCLDDDDSVGAGGGCSTNNSDSGKARNIQSFQTTRTFADQAIQAEIPVVRSAVLAYVHDRHQTWLDGEEDVLLRDIPQIGSGLVFDGNTTALAEQADVANDQASSSRVGDVLISDQAFDGDGSGPTCNGHIHACGDQDHMFSVHDPPLNTSTPELEHRPLVHAGQGDVSDAVPFDADTEVPTAPSSITPESDAAIAVSFVLFRPPSPSERGISDRHNQLLSELVSSEEPEYLYPIDIPHPI